MNIRTLHICLLWAFLLCSLAAQAEIIRLKSGKTVQGTIIFRNEEVVVFKDQTGARFQYLLTDIESIASDDELDEEVILEEVEVPVHKAGFSLSFQLHAGMASLACRKDEPQSTIGGKNSGAVFGGDLYMGARGLSALPNTFIGGGVGYHACTMGGHTLSFLPIQFRAEALLRKNPDKHAPMAGLSLGYGVALSKNMRGGLYAGIDLGWHYQFSPKNAFFLGAFANFQNAQTTIEETINNVTYSSKTSRNLCGFGAKAAIYF